MIGGLWLRDNSIVSNQTSVHMCKPQVTNKRSASSSCLSRFWMNRGAPGQEVGAGGGISAEGLTV